MPRQSSPLQFNQNRFLRIEAVQLGTGLPRSTIYEKAAKGQFPKSVKLSPRRSAWLEAEVAAWVRARIAERDDKAPGSRRRAR
jgi:prophage regulatory protein